MLEPSFSMWLFNFLFFFRVNLSSEYIWPSYKSEHNPIPGESCSLAWNGALSLQQFPERGVFMLLETLY